MIEMSVPELFSGNRRKIGEVLLKPSDGISPDERLLLARLPGVYVIPKPGRWPLCGHVLSALTDHVQLFGCEAWR